MKPDLDWKKLNMVAKEIISQTKDKFLDLVNEPNLEEESETANYMD